MTDPAGAPGATSAALAELVAVMDRLRSPGGCPWDAEQTHASLARYAVEEVAELVEAIETEDRAGLREELGDVLLQVVFHARVAQEHPDDPFDLGDVAADLVAKLRRRHPHVFADGDARDVDGVVRRWEELKQDEKRRASVLDGIPGGLPALARAQKVAGRARRLGLAPAPGDDLGSRLLAAVADEPGDAEQALRAAVRALEERVRAAEAAGTGGVVGTGGGAAGLPGDAVGAAQQTPG